MPEESRIHNQASRYRKSYKMFSDQIAGIPRDTGWQRFGVFSYYDEPYVDNDNLYLSPKQVLVALANLVKGKDKKIVYVADALKLGGVGLSTADGYSRFIDVFDSAFPDSKKYYFGLKDSEKEWLHGYPSLKIPLQWLRKRPNVFAEILSDASPIGEVMGPADASFEDFAEMTEVLVEKLGPPSLTEEVLGKLKSGKASEYAGEAVGLMTALISPASAVSRGVKYLSEFVRLLRHRRRQEVKEVYDEWRQKVMDVYSEEKLKQFFDDNPGYESRYIKAMSDSKPLLLITETRGTLYDLFLPLFFQHFAEKMGCLRKEKRQLPEIRASEDWHNGERIDHDAITPIIAKDKKSEIMFFIDGATHLSKLSKSFTSILDFPDKYDNISVAASFFTDRESLSESFERVTTECMRDWAFIFDLHPRLFELATSKMPISEKACLNSQIQELNRIKSGGGVAFLEYRNIKKGEWQLLSLGKPKRSFVDAIKSIFGRDR